MRMPSGGGFGWTMTARAKVTGDVAPSQEIALLDAEVLDSVVDRCREFAKAHSQMKRV